MAGATCNDFLTPSEQMAKTETRIPVQSKIPPGPRGAQPPRSTAQSRVWGEATRAEAAAETGASPAVSSASRHMHREFRDERALGGSPLALALDAELREQHRPAAGRGAAARPGHPSSGRDGTRWVAAHARPGRGQPGTGRSSSSPQPTSSNPEAAFTGRGDNEVLGCS